MRALTQNEMVIVSGGFSDAFVAGMAGEPIPSTTFGKEFACSFAISVIIGAAATFPSLLLFGNTGILVAAGIGLTAGVYWGPMAAQMANEHDYHVGQNYQRAMSMVNG